MKNYYIIVIAIVCGTLSRQVYTKCPASALLKPCICYELDDQSQLICSRINVPDIKALFQNISKALDEKDRQFDLLELSDKRVAELPAQTFADLKFKQVSLSDINGHMDAQVLKGTTDSVEVFTAMQVNLTSSTDLLSVVNSLENLDKLSITYSNINIIPENAFKGNHKLSNIKIGLVNNLTISGNAFKSLGSSLKYLELSNANITAIGDYAFAFDDTLKTRLRLALISVNLEMSGVSKSAFAGSKRPVSLTVLNEKAYLDESFYGTFMKQNALNEVMTKINCNDCRNVWLKKPEFATQVNGIFCTNGLELNDPKNFAGC